MTQAGIEVSVDHDGTAGWASIAGEIDAATAPAVEHELDDVSGLGLSVLTIDVSQVGFVDSAGLRVLINLRNRVVDRGGVLRLTGLSPSFRRLLDLTGLLAELAPDA